MMAVRPPASNPYNQFGIAAEQMNGYINPLFLPASYLYHSIRLRAFTKNDQACANVASLLLSPKAKQEMGYVLLSSAFRSFTQKSVCRR